MKVLQLIDSLDAGGAERMAVNLANALADHVEVSYVCSTRTEGLLKNAIDPAISYYFLNKRSRFDMVVLYKLYQWVRKENINIIHAHSSSFFFGTLIKMIYPKLKLIWHDHYGQSEQLSQRPYRALQLCSRWFDLAFCVNTKLVAWNTQYLRTVPIQLLSNFVLPSKEKVQETHLQGTAGKRIICLANLRPQKDHLTLLEAFKEGHTLHPEWTLHLVGKDFEDAYADQIKTFIKDEKLEESVFLYGSKSDTEYMLSQCEMGVLSSMSEGLPLVLMEYGLNGLAVIATDVGDCNRIIKNNHTGQLIEASNVKAMSQAMQHYMEDVNDRQRAASQLKKHVQQQFSKEVNITIVLENYKHLLS